MMIPTKEQIESLHRKHAPSDEIFAELWQHCQIVERIALEVIAGQSLGVDSALVSAGALLHDIGIYKLYNEAKELDEQNYIRHGVLGYELLKAEGFDEKLCRFASHHTGVGLSAHDISEQQLPLPHVDMLADTSEERLVMYADKFHSKHPARFNTVASYRDLLSRFGDAKVALFDEMVTEYGAPDTEGLAVEYGLECR